MRERWILALRRTPREEKERIDHTKLVFSLSDFNAFAAASESPPSVSAELGEILSDAFQLFWHEYSLSAISEKLQNEVRSLRSVTKEAAEALGNVINELMVFRSACLHLLTDCQFLAFYPATYEVRGVSAGRELVIAMYSEQPSEATIKSELHKFHQIFEQMRSLRQEAAAGARTTAEIVHRLPSTLGAIRNVLLAQRPAPKIPVLFNSLYLFSSLAKLREGLAPEAPNWGEIEDLFDSLPPLRLAKNQLQGLWNDLALPIARSRLLQSTSSMGSNPPLLKLEVTDAGFDFESIEEARVAIGAILVMMIEAIQHAWPPSGGQDAFVVVQLAKNAVTINNQCTHGSHKKTISGNQYQELLAMSLWLQRLSKKRPCIAKPANPLSVDSSTWQASLQRTQS